MVIHFKPKSHKMFKINNLKNLEKITHIIFSSKRKMINKSLKKILNKEDLENIYGLDMSLRPNQLKPEIYYKIAEIFESK